MEFLRPIDAPITSEAEQVEPAFADLIGVFLPSELRQIACALIKRPPNWLRV